MININQQAMSMRCSVEGLQLAAICAEVRLDEAGSGTACAAVRSSNASVLRVTAAEAQSKLEDGSCLQRAHQQIALPGEEFAQLRHPPLSAPGTYYHSFLSDSEL